jgi:hypothetical protein
VVVADQGCERQADLCDVELKLRVSGKAPRSGAFPFSTVRQ